MNRPVRMPQDAGSGPASTEGKPPDVGPRSSTSTPAPGLDVILDYDSGFPTLLRKHARLAAMLAAHGAPVVARSGPFYRLEWPPIFPGVPDPFYELRDPWPRDGRRIVGVRLAKDSF